MKFTEFDNIRRDYSIDENGTVIVKSSEYLDGHIRYCKNMRDNEASNQAVGDKDVLYASIPVIIAEELIKRGFDVFDKNNAKQLLKIIDRDYPYLKTTNMQGGTNA